MAKATVSKLFLGGLVALIAGVFVCAASVWVAFANNVFILEGPDVTGITATPLAWTILAIAAVGCLAAFGGALAMLVAWIGALVNTAQLQSKVWFLVLLIVGVTCFGFIPMLAYVIAGPDETEYATRFSPQPA